MISFKDFLLEANSDRYKTILNDLPEGDRALSTQRVEAALRNLPSRDDVIQWYLRYLKYEILKKTYVNLTPSQKKFMEEFTAKVKASKFGGDVNKYSYGFLTHIIHFLSLPIKAIKDFRFSYEHPNTILEYFEKLEKDWKENNTGSKEWIDITDELEEDDIEELIKFGDGYAWYYLKRHACQKEGDAMGHCGNVPSSDRAQRILSFRKVKKQGNKIFTRPSMTFILNSDKTLGEMKGRGNEKPDEKYHKYILALLELKMDEGGYFIKGITGGGYKPEANFSIADLDKKEQTDLIEKRPELITRDLAIVLNNGIVNEEIIKKYDRDWRTVTITPKFVTVHPRIKLEDFLENDAPDSMKRAWKYAQNPEFYDNVTDDEIVSFIRGNIEFLKSKGYDMNIEEMEDEDDIDEYDSELVDAVRYAIISAMDSAIYKDVMHDIIQKIEKEEVEIDMDDRSYDEPMVKMSILVDEKKQELYAQFDPTEFGEYFKHGRIIDIANYFNNIPEYRSDEYGDRSPYVSSKEIQAHFE